MDTDKKQLLTSTKTAKKILLVVLLLILIEVLYLNVDGTSWRAGQSICYSFSFPFRSVDYGVVTGEKGPLSEDEWVFGLKADPFLLVIDIIVILILGIMLVRSIPTSSLVSVVMGCVLGSVTGGIFSWLGEVSPESWVSLVVTIIMTLVLIPFVTYAFSLRHKWQKTAIIVISAVIVFTFWRSLFLVEGLFDGLMQDDASLNLSVLLRLTAIVAIPACECFVIMLLHRKVFPASWQKRRSNHLRTITEQKSIADSSRHWDRTWGGRLNWRAILYLVMLAVSLYVGFHFWTLREIRYNPFCVSDAISSELERQEISLHSWNTYSWPDSSDIGWNASFVIKICAGDEDRYYARISKHILIPWIQVDIQEIKTGDQVEKNQISNQE